MKIVKYKILYERGMVTKLASRLGVTEQTVRNALRFATEGEQPDLIREIALKDYGCVIQRKTM
jgi:predicted transcriptional regulator